MSVLESEGKTSVKVVGSNGQISLGKEFAGRQILVEERESGVWLIRTVKVVPHNELWLHEPAASRDLGLALAWAKQNPPRASKLGTLFGSQVNEPKEPQRKSRQTRSE